MEIDKNIYGTTSIQITLLLRKNRQRKQDVKKKSKKDKGEVRMEFILKSF